MPVRRLDASKSRLAPLLTPRERAALTLAMLRDVLSACERQPEWHTWVISADPVVLEVAVRAGARGVPDTAGTLLGAVHEVERRTAGRASRLAILLADLPWITADALRRALEPADTVVGVRAASDGGTNLLVRRPPTVIPARFGASSFERHEHAAARAGLVVRRADSEELAFDLDRPEDVGRMFASRRGGRALDQCLEMGVGDRLRTMAVGGAERTPSAGG